MKIKVKPTREGLKVPKQRSGFFAAAGEDVEKTTYITRLIKGGDLAIVQKGGKK